MAVLMRYFPPDILRPANGFTHVTRKILYHHGNFLS